MLLYYNWLQDKIASNVPINEWVQELLGANGGTFKNPATNYYQIETDILKVTENVAQVFMGMRIQCAQCHNHPFDRWTMDDYYGFAAFFTQIGRKGGDDPRELIVFNSRRRRGDPPGPRPADDAEVPRRRGCAGRRRARTAARCWPSGWPSPENPYFATNLSNIVWDHFFGQGIIDEVDDVRISQPGIEPGTARRTGQEVHRVQVRLQEAGPRHLHVADVPAQRHSRRRRNEGDTRNFARGPIRRIRAETMLDSITQVTETKNKFPGLPLGARAVQIADGGVSTYFLTTFGRPTRETVCSCEVKLEPTLSQTLHLLNGDHGRAEDRAGQPRRQDARRRRRRPRRSSRTCTSAV